MTILEVPLFELLRASVALFVIVDPIGLVPVFVGLTKDMKSEQRRRTFSVVVATGTLLLLLFAVVGQQILQLFGITLHSFMIAGGILLLILSIQSLISGRWVEKNVSADDMGIVPMAFPLLVGPGAITAILITLQTSGIVVALVSIFIVMLITWVIFAGVDKIHALLGGIGSTVVARLMAVFIAAIAIQFMLTGFQFYYPVR